MYIKKYILINVLKEQNDTFFFFKNDLKVHIAVFINLV